VSEDLALADMDRAITAAQAIVAGIRDEQWAAPTPCTGVDVRALVNHAKPGVLTATYAAPFGPALGVALVRARIVEHLGHGWDLARATGQRASFPDDVVERAIAAARRQLADRPEGPGSAFAAEVPVPADAPAIDRFAGFLGRPV
jgi:hypothetical protein